MEQEIFVHAYEVVRPIVLKASRQYFIQLWDQADMEQEAMMTLYQLLKKFPELASDDDKLRRYFKTKFRNRLNDEVRRQESVKRQANRQCYIEISDIAFCLPNISISHRASIPNLPVSTFLVILSDIGKFFIASRSESHSP